MQIKRLGCLSGTGLSVALFTLLVITGIGIARGGVIFNPGPLNAQAGSRPLGGVQSHAETGGDCAACHAPFWSAEKMDDRCLACHTELQGSGDFHRVMLAQSASLSCRACHTDHQGAEGALTILNLDRFPHIETGYSLQAHQRTDSGVTFVCADCHASGFPKFDLAVCEACHREMDASSMDRHVADFGRDCRACHDGLDTYGADFSHDQTSYPLEGSHRQVACRDCHQPATSLAALQATPQACFGCHAADDSHFGKFDQDCAVCHRITQWSQADFDHQTTTFALTGAHSSIACADCHTPAYDPYTHRNCVGCHTQDDAHAGQFGADCQVCHTTETWEGAAFDHAQTAFPLTGAHVAVLCTACHLDEVYIMTPRECIACHSQDDAHDGQLGADCAACHTTESWEQVAFDHSTTAFQLTGAHTTVVCRACHAKQTFLGTPTECANCHADPTFHRGLFDTNCEACHSTSAWRPAKFERAHRFPLNHGNSSVSSCAACHVRNLSAYSCYGCHEHNPAEIEEEHREEGISNFQDCTRCHPTGREEEVEGRDGGGREDDGDD